MDRTLIVLKAGHELAKVAFHYETNLTGIAHITINGLKEIDGGMIAVYPLYLYQIPILHDKALTTIDEIKAYDKQLLAAQEHFAQYAHENLDYTYCPMYYRYLISTGEKLLGIANINANFNDNKKEIHFSSGQKIKQDMTGQSNSVEANQTALRRICAAHLSQPHVSVIAVHE